MKDNGMVMMKNYTTIKTGGPARMVVVERKHELQKLIEWYRDRIFILGNGSNIIVKDNGIKGVVLKNQISGISQDGERITVGSGVSMPELSKFAKTKGLSGLEFAEGIPGTIGGGIYMNAGFKQDMASVIETVEGIIYTSRKPKIIKLSNKECQFGFRKSIFQEKNIFITEATIRLKKQDRERIAATMKEYHELRAKRQPLHMPSAGSIFKKCPNINIFYGFRVNQVEFVSPGFIVNHGGGSTYDIEQIIKKIQKETNAKLEVEII